jgi:hypothetical protein
MSVIFQSEKIQTKTTIHSTGSNEEYQLNYKIAWVNAVQHLIQRWSRQIS